MADKRLRRVEGFVVGARVVFFSNPSGYVLRRSNPLWNGEEGKVVGTISSIGSNNMGINWDNGTSDDYDSVCIRLHSEVVKEEKRSKRL